MQWFDSTFHCSAFVFRWKCRWVSFRSLFSKNMDIYLISISQLGGLLKELGTLVWEFTLCWQHFPLLCLSFEVEMSVGRDTVWLERRWGKPAHLVTCQFQSSGQYSTSGQFQSSGQSRIMLVLHALPLLVRGLCSVSLNSNPDEEDSFLLKLSFLRRLRLQEVLRRQMQGEEDGPLTLFLEMQNRRAFHRPGTQMVTFVQSFVWKLLFNWYCRSFPQAR